MIRLIVQADDFGMCHSVNTGIGRAFRDGIATQSSVMAPCPWIDEAIELARALEIPIGMHCTLTCEWDRLRWGPLSGGESLRAPGGGFWRTVEDARENISPDEARAELEAQADRLVSAGLAIHYFDAHMGLACPAAFEHVCALHEKRFVYPGVDPCLALDSIAMLSHRPQPGKRRWMLSYLEGLGPGTHFLCTHPGEPSDELRAVTREDTPLHAWAEEYRASDLETLCDPEVARAVASHGIQLVSVADL